MPIFRRAIPRAESSLYLIVPSTVPGTGTSFSKCLVKKWVQIALCHWPIDVTLGQQKEQILPGPAPSPPLMSGLTVLLWAPMAPWEPLQHWPAHVYPSWLSPCLSSPLDSELGLSWSSLYPQCHMYEWLNALNINYTLCSRTTGSRLRNSGFPTLCPGLLAQPIVWL